MKNRLSVSQLRRGLPTMKEILNREIKGLMDEFPEVVDILRDYGVGCVECSVATCLLNDVVGIHNLSPEDEQEIMARIARVIYPGREVEIPLKQRGPASRPGDIAYSPPMKKLVDEHKLIKRFVALIPCILEAADLGREEGRRLILDTVDFIRSYADKYHHAKEEDILFKFFDPDLDILLVMHQDHESARAHVRAISAAVERRDAAAVREHLNAYHDLLTAHIKKEDEILYRWMDRQLTDTHVGKLFSQFSEVDQQFGNTPQYYERLIEEFELKFRINHIDHSPG